MSYMPNSYAYNQNGMPPTPYGYTNNFNIGNQYQQPPIKTEVVRVNGFNGAQAFSMQPNSSILLLDTQAPIVYLKTTDGAGYPSVIGYSISPLPQEEDSQTQSQQMVDISGLESRLDTLENVVRKMQNEQSNSSSSNQRRNNSRSN